MLHIIEESGMVILELLGGAVVLGALAGAIKLVSQYGSTILEALI